MSLNSIVADATRCSGVISASGTGAGGSGERGESEREATWRAFGEKAGLDGMVTPNGELASTPRLNEGVFGMSIVCDAEVVGMLRRRSWRWCWDGGRWGAVCYKVALFYGVSCEV